ncbi:MAG: hypothetical protein RL187_631 [Actinomycetota bacterium]
MSELWWTGSRQLGVKGSQVQILSARLDVVHSPRQLKLTATIPYSFARNTPRGPAHRKVTVPPQ